MHRVHPQFKGWREPCSLASTKQNTLETNTCSVLLSAASLALSVGEGDEKERDGTAGSDCNGVRAVRALMRVSAQSTVWVRTKGEQEQSRIGSKAEGVTG